MTRIFHAGLAPLTALGLLLAGSAVAQAPATDPHHPAQTPSGAVPAPAPQGVTMPMMGQMMGGGMTGQMMPMMCGGMMMPMMGMQAGQQGMMGWDHPMMGMMISHSEGLFAFLEVELGITEAQTHAWTAYTALLKPIVKKHQEAMQMMPEPAAKPRTWIERLTDSEAILSEHLEAMKKIRPAATALYAALTPEQKKKADELMPLMPGAVGMKMGARRDAN